MPGTRVTQDRPGKDAGDTLSWTAERSADHRDCPGWVSAKGGSRHRPLRRVTSVCSIAVIWRCERWLVSAMVSRPFDAVGVAAMGFSTRRARRATKGH